MTVKVLLRALCFASVQVDNDIFWIKANPGTFHRNWIDPLVEGSEFEALLDREHMTLTLQGALADKHAAHPPIGTPPDDEEENNQQPFTYILYPTKDEVKAAIR